MAEFDPQPPAAMPVIFARPITAPAGAGGDAASAPLARLNPLHLHEITPREARLDLILILGVPIGMIYVPAMMMAALNAGAAATNPAEPREPAGGFLVAAKCMELLIVCVLAMYLCKRHGLRHDSIGVRWHDAKTQVLWGLTTLIAAYGYMFGVMLLLIPFAGFFESEHMHEDIERRVQFAAQLPTDDFTTLAALMFAVAFHEEILFRGLLLTHLRRATGAWWSAVALSSMIFGILHFPQGWTAMLMITGLSVLLSVFFILSRSLIAVAIAHFLFNMFQVQLLKFITENAHLFEGMRKAAQ